METFLLERTVPPSLRSADPAEVAQHTRWAVDGYRQIGAQWMGGVITDAGMFSLVCAESADDVRRYWRGLGVADEDARLRRVLSAIGPFTAGPRT